MVSVVLVISLFSILFVGLLGVYAFAFKIMRDMNSKLSDIYRTVNNHVQSTVVHLDPKHPVVTEAVCEQVQVTNGVHFEILKEGQAEIKSSLRQLVAKWT